MDSHLRWFAARQQDLVAAWQLRGAGWAPTRLQREAQRGGWRRIHSGVYALTQSPLTREQRWWAAVLTAPGTVLSHGSGGACFAFLRFDPGFEVVTRPGRGGRRRHGSLLVFRSNCLDGHTTRHEGIPVTTAARTLIDLAPSLDDRQLGRAFREAIRLKRTTAQRVRDCLGEHAHRPGTPRLAQLAARYADLSYHRTRSDAEGRALELLYNAGVEPPRVNVRVAGEEADLVWFERRRIVEIDGGQYHQFRDEDARKEALWCAAGFSVRRVSSGDVYAAPERLLAAAAADR